MKYPWRLWFHIVTKDMLTHDYWRTLTRCDDWIPTVEIPTGGGAWSGMSQGDPRPHGDGRREGRKGLECV